MEGFDEMVRCVCLCGGHLPYQVKQSDNFEEMVRCKYECLQTCGWGWKDQGLSWKGVPKADHLIILIINLSVPKFYNLNL